jgi:hypothetical protein
MFSYNSTHRVVIYHLYKSCVIPGPSSQQRHLRAELHRLSGDELSTTMQLLSSYNLRTVEELRENKPQPLDECQLIEHLASYNCRSNVNSPIRTSAIGLLQHLQLLYLPS